MAQVLGAVSSAGESGLTALAHAVGVSGDLRDEHVRWELYQEALRRGALELLLATVVEDPDHTMAAGAVVAALEQVLPGERERWVTATAGWSTADFVARRADELAVLELVSRTVGDEGLVGDEDVGGWSDWLQRRASVPATRSAVLETLAANGRTRRIRLQAAEALARRE
ncbi:hypothetical protein ACFVQ3_07955 [Oerskovia sp. NPDC057915]|uniref:hypothetical protein n=1 Tax=Oerskovia sp. NPDC057915 TaxID=3346280 RepID=UPI0036D907BE